MNLSLKFHIIIIFSLLNHTLRAQNSPLVEKVNFEGHKKTKRVSLERIVAISKGSVLDSLVMEKDMQRLKRIPSYHSAKYEVTKGSEANQYIVTYHIKENFTIIPAPQIYTTNDDEFAFRFGLYDHNFLGKNMQFGGFYQYDIFSSAGINFRSPFLFSQRFGLAAGYQNLTTLEPVFLEKATADYQYNNESLELIGIYQINFFHTIEAGINVFQENYQYLSGATDENVPLQLKLDKINYKFLYKYENIKYHLQYLDGFKNIFNFQYVTNNVDDNQTFKVGWNDLIYFKRIAQKGNLASRVRIGFSDNNDTPFAPFSVDNNINIRGVGNIIDRGTASIVINLEYRQTFYEDNTYAIQGNSFIDSGTWRNPGGELRELSDSENIRVYTGLGLRLIHKKIFNATLRIDYGYGITEESTQGLVFGIGQYF